MLMVRGLMEIDLKEPRIVHLAMAGALNLLGSNKLVKEVLTSLD